MVVAAMLPDPVESRYGSANTEVDAMTVLADQRRANTSANAVVTDVGRTRRRWSPLVGGLLLVMLCASVFAVVQLSNDDRMQVLAVARPVAAGQVISAEDLRPVLVAADPSVPLVAATSVTSVVGRTASVPLAAGTLLAPSQLGPPSWPAAGQAVVAVLLKPGRAPAGLAAGSRVRIVTVAPDSTTSTDVLPAAPVSVPAVVTGVSEGVDGAGTSVVSLQLAQDDAARIAGAGLELALVLVGN
jgi:hypothetical protein